MLRNFTKSWHVQFSQMVVVSFVVSGSNDMDKITLSQLKTQVKMGSKSGHINSQVIPANITFNKNNSSVSFIAYSALIIF